jgi:hypothetical protein
VNIVNVERLIAALRSGKYTQGRFTMCDIAGNKCCLGVAYDLLVEPIAPTAEFAKRTINITEPEYAAVLAALAIGNYEKRILMEMNDDRKQSFAEIASFLEGMLHVNTRLEY